MQHQCIFHELAHQIQDGSKDSRKEHLHQEDEEGEEGQGS